MELNFKENKNSNLYQVPFFRRLDALLVAVCLFLARIIVTFPKIGGNEEGGIVEMSDRLREENRAGVNIMVGMLILSIPYFLSE